MELFKLFGSIAIDNTKAKQALDETTIKAKTASKETESGFKKIGQSALTIGKGIITAGAVIGGAWIAAIEGSREYRTEMGKLDTAFTTNGHSSETAKKTYQDLQAVLGETDVAVEASNHLALLTDNEKDLQTWTNICTGVYATFGASLPIEGLTEAANETAKTGTLTGGLVDALNWAGIGEEEFQAKLDACSTEQERQKLIMDTLNGTYSKASEQYQKTNKDVMDANRANEALTSAFAKLGEVGEPILTAIKTKVAEMVELAVPKIEEFIQKVKDLQQWIKDNEQTIETWKAVILGVTVAISSFVLVMQFSAIMNAAKTAITGVKTAMLALNVAMKSNPVGLVISLIAGLVTAFILLWNNNKEFRQFWLDLWEKIKSACGTAVTWIKNKFNDLKGALSTVKETFSNIQKTISEKINSAKDKVKDAIDKIKGFFKFKWSLPDLKVPSFTMKGKFSLDPPSVPKIGIKWNAKGGILQEPTVFGQLANGTFLGGGEAGSEAIAPIETLQNYINSSVSQAMAHANETISRTIIEQTEILIAFLSRVIPKEVLLDSGAMVGQLTPGIDAMLSDRWNHSIRGNVR